MTRGFLEPVFCLIEDVILESMFVDMFVDDLPWQTRSPESHLTVAQAILEKAPGVELIGMPHKKDVYSLLSILGRFSIKYNKTYYAPSGGTFE